jgi:hypothetical protein
LPSARTRSTAGNSAALPEIAATEETTSDVGT